MSIAMGEDMGVRFLDIEVLDPPFRKSLWRKNRQTAIVLHATAGSTLGGAIQTLRDKKLGYHYLIDKSGKIVKGQATSAVVGHAGRSKGPDGSSANNYSIGISLVNLNDGEDPYTERQYLALQALIDQLRWAVPSLKWITTHRAISKGISGKSDPRALKWQRLDVGKLLWWNGNGWGLV